MLKDYFLDFISDYKPNFLAPWPQKLHANCESWSKIKIHVKSSLKSSTSKVLAKRNFCSFVQKKKNIAIPSISITISEHDGISDNRVSSALVAEGTQDIIVVECSASLSAGENIPLDIFDNVTNLLSPTSMLENDNFC